jgi:hypothetical protein
VFRHPPKLWLPEAESRLKPEVQRFFREDTMSRSGYMEGTTWVRGGKKEWPPTVKMVLAFIVGFLALSPAILGIYWEMFLSK